MVFMAFIAGDKMDEGGGRYIFVIVGVVRMFIPILMGNFLKGIILKIAFWPVIALSGLKLLETLVAVYFEGLGFIWYLVLTGLVEIAVLIHLLSPKARAELNNQQS